MSEIEYVVSFGEHPSIDDCGALREKVVRCRDCQHFITSGASEISFCARVDYEMNPDDFCSYGKRKEGGE